MRGAMPSAESLLFLMGTVAMEKKTNRIIILYRLLEI
jgi:hypothetical protein